MKQERLNEVAERYAEPYRCPATNENEYCKHDIISAFNNGAKWQQERSYSEEDLKEAFKDAYSLGFRDYLQVNFKQEKCDEWFKQFKNK